MNIPPQRNRQSVVQTTSAADNNLPNACEKYNDYFANNSDDEPMDGSNRSNCQLGLEVCPCELSGLAGRFARCIPIGLLPVMIMHELENKFQSNADVTIPTCYPANAGPICCTDHDEGTELQNIQTNLVEPTPIVTSAELITEPQVTNLGEFPWSALIQYRKMHGFFGFHCGGSLIHERFVITAAHCIKAIPPIWKVFRVRLGEYDTKNGNLDCVNGRCADVPLDIEVDQIRVHESYTARDVSQLNDIALIRLMLSVRMTDFVQPIQLASGAMENMMMNGAPMEVVSAGWGRTKTGNSSNVKLKVRLDISDFNACTEAYEHAGAQLQDTQICASEWRGTGICSCDSGGPLMVQTSNSYYLVGIVSFGPANCGMKDVPGVYTNVMKYTDWVSSHIRYNVHGSDISFGVRSSTEVTEAKNVANSSQEFTVELDSTPSRQTFGGMDEHFRFELTNVQNFLGFRRRNDLAPAVVVVVVFVVVGVRDRERRAIQDQPVLLPSAFLSWCVCVYRSTRGGVLRTLIRRNQYRTGFPSEMTIFLRFWVGFVIIVAIQAVDLYDPCEDASGAPGLCVPIKSCEPISAILKRGNLSSEERIYLKKSNCGMMGSGRAICCPLPKMLKARFSAPATLPAVGICGVDSGSRIVGGEVAQLDEYPWLARIQYYKSNKRFGFHCGGVLINDRYVLTAAHCIQNVPTSWKVYKIRLGEYDTESDVECNFHDKDDCANSVQDVLISSYYIHEDYFQENGADYNDIALIRLSTPVNYTAYISPICLPVTDELKKLSTEGKKMTVAGWGQTETGTPSRYKKFLQIEGWQNARCEEAFTSANVDIIESQLCAGGTKGEDSCRGDSGGPLMKLETVGRQSAWFLKGIVSFGSNKCGTENVPGVYTRLSNYVDWILENIEE
ncbi:uncharacterized protein LOC131428745 [Malaya genurostris]|uniref:uncharacterized protein LOC131428745 n=1 Tax=Malaya genurostris TaxID=325434 RepID=UPI0026F3DF02|nr:uncharacterized protein LOC131428745 [Malaya genurostris]